MFLNQCQGSVVGVTQDMIVARYNSKGVLFKGSLLANRVYKVDDIIQFNAKKATTLDIEIGDDLGRSCGYEISWIGTEIKFIKQGKLLVGEGVVLNIPDPQAQFMFVDWKYTKNPPTISNKCTTTNVFVTRASIRPEIEKLTEMFKVGQRVKFIAREQAPNDRGVCWRSAIATDEFHEITTTLGGNNNRPSYQVQKKSTTRPTTAISPPPPTVAPTVAAWIEYRNPQESKRTNGSAPWSIPKRATPEMEMSTEVKKPVRYQLPLPTCGYVFLDTSKEACNARFKEFVEKYRKENPTDIFSQRSFEQLLRIKYLNELTEQLTIMNAVREEREERRKKEEEE